MNILRRKILGPVTLLHLIAFSASIAAVSGAAMLYYSWNIELTLAQTDVTFYKWSDGTTANYLVLNYNYYAGVTTEDWNASWGIWNRGASNKTVYLWADSPYMSLTIDGFDVVINDDTGNYVTSWGMVDDWSNIGESNAVSWIAVAGMKYTIVILIHASPTPADPTEEIVLRLKTAP